MRVSPPEKPRPLCRSVLRHQEDGGGLGSGRRVAERHTALTQPAP